MFQRRTHLNSAAIIVVAVFGSTVVFADDIVLSDHFDDGAIDPAWQITFDNASGWSHSEAGTNLVATGINHVETDEWSRVRLTRPMTPLGDFHMRADIAWVSGVQAEVMQYLIVSLRDAEGSLVAQSYYWDAWVGWRGALGGDIEDGSAWDSGANTAPFDGSRMLEIGRSGPDVTIWINGAPIVAGVSDLPVEKVCIEFGFFPYAPGGDGNVVSLFGVESIDLIEVIVPSVACPGDLDDNGVVNVTDLLAVLSGWGTPNADVDGDGITNITDLLAVLAAWGACA